MQHQGTSETRASSQLLRTRSTFLPVEGYVEVASGQMRCMSEKDLVNLVMRQTVRQLVGMFRL